MDILRVEKYFEKDAWLSVLKSTKKIRVDFVCSVYAKMINDKLRIALLVTGVSFGLILYARH